MQLVHYGYIYYQNIALANQASLIGDTFTNLQLFNRKWLSPPPLAWSSD